MADCVDIYYNGTLCFRHIRVEEVEGLIQGWMEGGNERGRSYDRSKFSTEPSKFEEGVPPIAGMSREEWDQIKEQNRRDKLDLETGLRLGLFIRDGDGNVRFAPVFAKALGANCSVDRNLQDEELLYGTMISIRESFPHLADSEFLAVRRVVMRRAIVLRDAWKRNRPGEKNQRMEEYERGSPTSETDGPRD